MTCPWCSPASNSAPSTRAPLDNRRACATGNALLVRSAAAELPQLSLADALRFTLVLAAGEPERFPRAAAKWLARLALETPAVQLADVQFAAGALAELPSRPDMAREALAGLAEALALPELIEVLDEDPRQHRLAPA